MLIGVWFADLTVCGSVTFDVGWLVCRFWGFGGVVSNLGLVFLVVGWRVFCGLLCFGFVGVMWVAFLILWCFYWFRVWWFGFLFVVADSAGFPGWVAYGEFGLVYRLDLLSWVSVSGVGLM